MASPAAFAPSLDDDDEAIVQEAAFGRLATVDKREVVKGQASSLGAAWTILSGSHTPTKMRLYRVRAGDGLEWTYAQPYSHVSQMPGEHRFVLRGALPHAVEVLPPSNQWRRPRFLVAVLGGCAALTLFFGLGLVLLAIILLTTAPRARYRSTDPRLAAWLKAQPELRDAVLGTRWGWLGVLGAGGWRLPWAVQLHSLGNGTSRLVIKAPDVGRLDFRRWRVGFTQAELLARTFQRVLAPGSFAPAQHPMQPTLSS